MYVIIKPSSKVFKGEKTIYESGRKITPKVIVEEISFCEVKGEQTIDGQKHLQLELIMGQILVYKRTKEYGFWEFDDYTFYVPVGEVEVANAELGDALKQALQNVSNWRGEKAVIDIEGKKVATKLRQIDIEETIKCKEVMILTDRDKKTFVKYGDFVLLKEFEPIETLALAKEFGEIFDLKIINTENVLAYDVKVQYDIKEFNFSSDISGKLCVRKEELFNFQEDLLRLTEKYHLPVYDLNINIKSKSELRSFWADSGFLQVHFHNNKKDIKEILHKHRGKITGNKFGL